MISAGLPIACGLNGSTGYFQPRAAERRITLQAVALAHQDHRDVAAARGEFRRRDKTVAAIVAAPGDHQDRPLLHEIIAASATACPALSISAKPGVPAAIVSRSARSISAVVRTSMPNPQSNRLFQRHISRPRATCLSSTAHELIYLPN